MGCLPKLTHCSAHPVRCALSGLIPPISEESQRKTSAMLTMEGIGHQADVLIAERTMRVEASAYYLRGHGHRHCPNKNALPKLTRVSRCASSDAYLCWPSLILGWKTCDLVGRLLSVF